MLLLLLTCVTHAWATWWVLGDNLTDGWTKTNNNKMLTSGSNSYVYLSLTSGTTYYFKIHNGSWDGGNTRCCNTSTATVTLGTDYQTYNNNNASDKKMEFTPSTTGVYKFNLNSSNVLLITQVKPTAAAPSNVVSGTNIMFYIKGQYAGWNYLVNSSKAQASTSYPLSEAGYSYVNTAKSNVATYDRISNNPGGWAGNQNTTIQDAKGGELFDWNKDYNVAAKTATTSTSVSGDVLSISTEASSTTGVWNSLQLYIQYYIDGTFVGVTYSSSTASYASIPASGTTARESTYDVSGLTNGSHTLKTVLTDGNIFYVADTKTFDVAHTYSVTLDDDGSYQGNGSASVKYGDKALTISSHAERDGWNLLGYWNSSAAQVSDASGNLIAGVTGYTNSDGEWIYDGDVTLYAHWSQTNSLTVSAGSHIASTSGTTSPVTLNTKYAISATADDGYTFSGWTASPAANGEFDDASSASTNVTVKNGSVTVTGAATENMTTVTVNVSPAGAGTLTKGGAAFTPGSTVSVGVTTGYSMVATANSGYIFRDWTKTGNAAGTPSTNTFPLNGNGSSGTGTLTANFGIASGWYMYGNAPWGNTWDKTAATAQLTYPYRGMSGVYYIPTTIAASKYFRITDKSKEYNFSSDGSKDFDLKTHVGTIYELKENTAKAAYSSSNLGSVWVVVNTNGTKKAWVQNPQTFYNVNVTGAENAKGPVKVTLKTSTAITKGDNVFETTQYASGETFTVTVTGVTGYIPTITIGGVSKTWWKEQATYTADGTMSSADVAVTISYTPTRAVRFAKTTGCKTLKATGPSSTAVEDNTKIKDGISITFHQENSTGYTFSKWYSNNTGTSGTSYSTSSSDYALTISSTAYTIYPIYDEDTHSVTVNAQTGGTVSYNGGAASSSCTARAGKVTASANIVATASTGYYFVGWQLPDGTITKASESAYNGSTSTYTIHATADSKTVTALFNVRYALLGSPDPDNKTGNPEGGMPGWGEVHEAPFTYSAGTSTYTKTVNLTKSNVNYKFRIVDRRASSHISYGLSSKAVIQADGDYHDLASTVADAQLATAGVGTYTLTVQTNASGYPKVKITNPASQRITMGILTQTDGATSAYTGGTISAEDERDNVITNGLYIRSGDDITFTATPKAGYIWHGWYDNAACDGGLVTTGRTFTDEDVTSDITRYALFEEALYTVTVHRNDVIETTVKVGVDTHPTIMASTAPTGKIFDRWVTTGSATVADAYASTTTINGATDNASTVTATFKELPKIYIDLTAATGWNPSNMYVVFYKDGGYFDSNNGTGLSSTYVINATPLEMTKMDVAGKNIWYYSYDPTSGDFAGKTITCVAFVDHTFAANYGNFTSATVVYRTDFSSCMNMFVVTNNTGTNKNGSCYYRNSNAISDDAAKGYWRKYEEKNSGFYLNNLPGGSVEFTNEDGGNTYSARVNLDANTTYYFYLGCCNGWNWSNNNTTKAFNSDNRTRMVEPYNDVSSDGLRCKLTTTAAGYYTFSLTPQNTREVQLSIDFPVAANDYRAVYNNAASSPTISRPSNIIKSDQNSGTISLWLNKGTNYISFQKASLGDGGAVTWSACGVQQTVTGVAEAGIYTMTLTRNGSTYTVSTPEKYDGDLYIRTDCAPGKWADYTENKLDENTFNFSATDPNTFDYYYCKWINDAGTNVRCVIANDINVALSDTLIGDAVIGMGNQTTPSAVSVRFSYNSYTNEIKRSYLGASTTDDFLRVLGNTTASAKHIYDKNETTFNDANADSYIKFEDKQNWRYEIVIKADANARAKLTASFNGQTQYFMGQAGESGHEWDDANTEQLFGGAGGTYGLTLVYDFKTNKLIRAWKPTGDAVNADLELQSDVLLLREHQGAPTAITFGKKNETDYASLTEVKTVYSVLRFNRWKLNNRAHPEDTNSDHCNSSSAIATHHPALAVDQDDAAGKWLPQAERELYFISFPYDVKMSDIIHFGGYYDKWGIMYYDGKGRAKNGYWIDSESNWKYFTPEEFATGTLNAYEGYLIGIDLDQMRYDNTSFWTNHSSEVDIYFPSKEPVSTITQQEVTVPIDTVGYQCTINRTYGGNDGDRRIKDSHWHCIGVPAYANLTQASTHTGEPDENTNWKTDNLLYIYSWRPATNDHVISDAGSFTFNAMYAYLVQYSQPTLSWAAAAVSPATPAARRMKTEELRDRQFNLQLMQGDKETDHTYIRLSDDEEVTTGFEFNHDVSKMMLTGANIYTLIGKEQAAANSLPLNMTQTTVVPVGVKIATAGDYTFAIPEGTDGVGVVLIDNIAGTRTNLALTDYTVSLTTGKIENRFTLEISPIQNTPTGIENAGDGVQESVRKVLIDGIMYIVRDGKVFDARGNRVK